MVGIVIKLSDDDIAHAKDFGDRMVGVETKLKETIAYTTSLDWHSFNSYFIGGCAEIAFAHAAGYPPHTLLEKVGSGDRGVDFRFYSERNRCDMTVDVKARKNVKAKTLIWAKDKMKEPYLGRMADVLVHSVVDDRFDGQIYVDLRGYCLGSWFKENCSISTGLDGMVGGTGFVHQDQLRDIYELVNAIRARHGMAPLTQYSTSTD